MQHRIRLVGGDKEELQEFEDYVNELYSVGDDLVDQWVSAMGEYVGTLRRGVTQTAIARAVQDGNPDSAEQEAPWEKAEAAALLLWLALLGRTVERAGRTELQRLGLTLPFDTTNRYAVQWLEEHGAATVRQITDETRHALRAVLVDAYRENLTPQQVAPRIQNLIGLTQRDAGAVLRYWQSLELPRNEAARLADDYAARLLSQRTMTVLETETVNGAAFGQHAAWLEARDKGLLPTDAMRQWVAAIETGRVCPICLELHGQQRGLLEPFESSVLGPIMAPTVHPRCRCAVRLLV